MNIPTMSIRRKQVPQLILEGPHNQHEEFSPRSEDFREETSSKFSIIIAPPLSSNIANVPNPTVPSQEKKNPLLSKQVDYSLLLKTQEQELIALHNINQKLQAKLLSFETDLNSIKDIPSLMTEKDKKIKSLEISLELAREELKMIIHSQKESNAIKSTMMAFEYFSVSRPKRVWAVSEGVVKLDNLKSEIFSKLFRSRNKVL